MARVIGFFEGLSPDDLARLDTLYAADARFKDPFNEVRGVPAIAAVFEHMYRTLEAPRFIVHQAMIDGAQGFVTWDFRFRFRRFDRTREHLVRGASHLVFADDGRIVLHRDYWDAAEELYEKLPVVGTLMRWLRHRVST